MISKNLSERLNRLEARVMPTGAPLVINVLFVAPGGEVTGSRSFALSPFNPNVRWRRRRRWSR